VKNILVIGQTPPPFHGQAVMIEKIVKAKYSGVCIHHIRMDFSDNVDQVGKFALFKILRLFALLFKAYIILFRNRIDAIHYPPAGTNKNAIYRDIIILPLLRIWGKKLIFHFHPLGLSDVYKKSGGLMKLAMRSAYFQPDLSIALSQYNAENIKNLNSKKVVIIPNGIDDVYPSYSFTVGSWSNDINVLFVGNICESKGIYTYLDVIGAIASKHHHVKGVVVGGFKDTIEEQKVTQHSAWKYCQYKGIITGDEKWKTFLHSDILFLPTQYDNLPTVILEAMQFELPVVASDVGSIPEMINQAATGYYCGPLDVNSFIKHLNILIENSSVRKKLGLQGRKLFLEKYGLNKYIINFQQQFKNI
jgi:glycosyltransferase involved in cell wall biosynthesis